jgi:DNA replicative helicase MCM subunit Mcm2 (Cdc46/Mcm family)
MSERCEEEEQTHVESTANFYEKVTNIYGYISNPRLQIPYNRIQEVLSEFLQLTPHYKTKFQHIKWHITARFLTKLHYFKFIPKSHIYKIIFISGVLMYCTKCRRHNLHCQHVASNCKVSRNKVSHVFREGSVHIAVFYVLTPCSLVNR